MSYLLQCEGTHRTDHHTGEFGSLVQFRPYTD
jgi:hypothetical protein